MVELFPATITVVRLKKVTLINEIGPKFLE